MAPPKKYPLIVKQVINEIRSGKYEVGSEFPTLDEMTKIYNISRVTAFRTLTVLGREGYVSAQRGRKSILTSRGRPLRLEGENISGTITVLADFNMKVNIGSSQKLVYSIMEELKSRGNHVICLQYCQNIDLRIEETDAYIMVDMLGIFNKFCVQLQETGKPYVVIGFMRDHYIRPNHLHLSYSSAFLNLVSYLLENHILNYIFCLPEEKSMCKSLGSDESRRLKSWIYDDLLRPFTDSLESHGCDRECIRIHKIDADSHEIMKAVPEILQENPPKTGIVAMSETLAAEIVRDLEKRDLLVNQDFHIALVDSITASDNNTQKKLHMIKIPVPPLIDKIIKSLDRQVTSSNNFSPGILIHSTIFQPMA